MNTRIRLLLFIFVATTLAQAADKIMPGKDLLAEWKEIQELKFSDWTIKKFLGWDIAGDGGSKGYFFESDGGERFDVIVANPAYWTEEDKQERRQVFFVIHKSRFYRIEPKSVEERNIIEKLTKAAELLTGDGKKDPKLLTSLAQRLESREPAFKPRRLTSHACQPPTSFSITFQSHRNDAV
ncbi:MAG TPA: hypothetical protein VF258_11015, partial [Luteolibacter sp.]